MPTEPFKRRHEPEGILRTGPDACMNVGQARQLKELAIPAYEPDAFRENLTADDATRRVAMLRTQLKLLD